MYLKSIEVQGFKSFANKITFQFHNGITGIVGPNGSGKSNVADAVRWVLGEQRIKQLRGASMQDVIFSGTEQRKPVSYAYVSITLDNSDHQLAIDYDEVTVARRIYRSGESEYLLNGSPCRLKDVNELFYDTGIGKEGYSIIGQGQIDRILSSKPEDRRELFDEAAGIVKFKRRKITAQKKLEEEQANLLRVNDILTELDRQRGPLEKQSEKARVYLKKKEELKVYDVNAFLLDYEKTTETLSELTRKCDITSSELANTTDLFNQMKEEHESIQSFISELETQIDATRNSLSGNSILREKLEGEIKLLKEQIKSASSNDENVKERLAISLEKLKEKETERDAILSEKKIIDEQMSEATLRQQQIREELILVQTKITEQNFAMEQAKQKVLSMVSERGEIRSQIASCDTLLEQTNLRKSELSSRILQAKSIEQSQQDIITSLENEFVKIGKEIEDCNNKLASMEERTTQIHDELGEKDKLLRDTQVQYHQEKSKLEAITNLTERYEGYSQSIKKVMEQKNIKRGVKGVVADIFKVDQKYETAIETALGGNIQNIVTDNEKTAKEMIEFLKKNQYGRATFLPLTSIQNPQEFQRPEALKEKGVIGMADTLVTTEACYDCVRKAMLGRILVINHVDNAITIARKYEYQIRMVTLDGELLVPGGAISGGTFKNNSNLLGRRREMDELKEKEKHLLQKIDSVLDEIEKIKAERNILRKNIEEMKSTIQQKFIDQNSARINVMQAEERKNEAIRGFGNLKEEENDIQGKLKQVREEKLKLEEKLKESENSEFAENEKIEHLKNLAATDRDTESEKAVQMTECDLEVQKMVQKQGFEQQNLDRVNNELYKIILERDDAQRNSNRYSDEIKTKQESIELITKTIEASYSTQTEEEQKLKDLICQKEESQIKQKTFYDKREQLTVTMGNLDKEVFRLTSQKDKMEESMDSSIAYMWSEYEITIRDAMNLKKEDYSDLPKMKREISKLKDEIRKLGDVNVNAIEDYKSVLERYEFLKTQHDDLIEAEKTLTHIIVSLDDAMRKQFHEKFQKIGNEFDKVFKELFGGGKGTLELLEDEDILEAGIRIIAQPPGKKLQNMMQLSGGEKALTAIALLFAIQNLKPSPFCLLDEIEAALDENNVERFAKYLSKLTKHTQFIVITHRRGTMQRADRLYGITMQEKGISTLVSVDLLDKDMTN